MTAQSSGPAVFVIAGMHRSGTSLVARVVNLLGVSLGDPAHLMEAKPDNPSGFWESRPIATFNDDLLAELGGRWDDPVVPDDGWERRPGLEGWPERAARLITDEFPSGGMIGWKDPRTSLLLPFWRRVVHVRRVVVVIRDPREVAASLQARDGVTSEQAADLWLKYNVTALRDSPGAVVVRYSAFFEDLEGTVTSLAAALELPPAPSSVLAEIAGFFDGGLRHHRGGGEPLGRRMATAVAVEPLLSGSTPAGLVDLLWGGLRIDRVDDELATARERVSRQDRHVAELIDERDVAVRRGEELEVTLAQEIEVARVQFGLQARALARVEGVAARLRGRLAEAEREAVDLRKRIAEVTRP